MKHHDLNIDGVRVSCYEWVSAPNPEATILCLHGFASSGLKAFRLLAEEELLARYRIVAPDLPGFGRSDTLSTYSLARYADIVAGIVDRLKLERTVIVGHSFGAKVALASVDENSDLFSALVLCNPAGFSGLIEKFVFLADQPAALWMLDSAFIRNIVKRLPSGSMIQSRRFRDSVKEISGSFSMLDLDSTGHRSKISSIDLPGLLIWGESDPILADSVRDRVQKQLQEIQVANIPGGGHMPMVKETKLFAIALVTFLEKL